MTKLSLLLMVLLMTGFVVGSVHAGHNMHPISWSQSYRFAARCEHGQEVFVKFRVKVDDHDEFHNAPEDVDLHTFWTDFNGNRVHLDIHPMNTFVDCQGRLAIRYWAALGHEDIMLRRAWTKYGDGSAGDELIFYSTWCIEAGIDTANNPEWVPSPGGPTPTH